MATYLKKGGAVMLKWYLFKTSILKRREKATEEAPQERLTERLYKKYKAKAETQIKDSNLPDDPDGTMFLYFEKKFMDKCFRFEPLSWGTIIDKFCTVMFLNFIVFMQLMVLFIKFGGITELISAFISFPLSFLLIGLWLYLDYLSDIKAIAECEIVLGILSMRHERESCYHFM